MSLCVCAAPPVPHPPPRVRCGLHAQAYKVFDVNEDGTVEYSEFVNAVKKLDLGLSDAQLFDFMGYLDEDRNSHIDFDEFVARFQVVHEQRLAVVSGESAATRRARGLTVRGVATHCWRARTAPFHTQTMSGRGQKLPWRSLGRLFSRREIRRQTCSSDLTRPTLARCPWTSSWRV